VLFWMRRHYRQIILDRAESSRLIVLKLGRLLLIIVLLVGLLAAMAGYAQLARLLTPGIFVGGVVALVMFACLRVSAGLIAVALRVWPLRSLQMVSAPSRPSGKKNLSAAGLGSGLKRVIPLPELSRSFG